MCGDVEPGIQPERLTGAFERYRLAIPECWVVQMLRGQAAFSREGPLSAWVVIWLMIFQRLDAGGTLSAAVRQLLTGGVRAFVRWSAQPLSANTSAYSQARSKLPVALIEKVSDMIFESLQEQLKSLPGLERQNRGKNAATAGRAAHRHRASLRFHDMARQGQAQPGPLFGLPAVWKLLKFLE